MKTLSWRPSTASTAKLFTVGATVGPIVDSLHNQCLLSYQVAPITIDWPSFFHIDGGGALLASSWTVPPLLGFAYVLLGGILPRLFQLLIDHWGWETQRPRQTQTALQQRALLAVTTTAAIIKLSDFLETHPHSLVDNLVANLLPELSLAQDHIVILLTAAFAQWAILDGSLAALLAASLTSIGGPLSELPFVSHGIWQYLPSAGDYMPLAGVEPTNRVVACVLALLLGDHVDYQHLALASITGPCYFAVTMDAIALGRWFDVQDE